MVVSKLESLPSELVVEIGDYLDACDLYRAFYGLNHRINTILDHQCHRLDVNFIRISKDQFDFYCTRILPRIAARITSLTLPGRTIFVHLLSLKLVEFTKSDVEILVPHLHQFVYLRNLSIGEYTRFMPFNINTNELFQEHVVLPLSLRSLAFPYEISDRWIQTSNSTLSIEQLHVTSLYMDTLISFMQRFPRLNRLTTVLSNPGELDLIAENISGSNIMFQSLRYLNLNIVSDVSFPQFASFLRHVPQLHTLIIEALNPDLLFFDAHQWEANLSANLSSFRFDLTTTSPVGLDHLSLLKLFKSDYWTSRGWFVQCHTRDRGRFFRLSTSQSPIINLLYWPDDEILVDSTSIIRYPHVTYVELWWNLSKSTQSICPHVRSIQFYGANIGEIETIHPNVLDLLNASSFEHIIIDNDVPISPTRLAHLLAKSSDRVSILTCSTHWLHSLFETRDNECICLLLTMRIRKLILNNSDLVLSYADLISFARTFINLQEISMKLVSVEEMAFLLNVLRQLTMASIELPDTELRNITNLTQWIIENTVFRNFTIEKRAGGLDSSKILLWIGSHNRSNLYGTQHQLYSNHPIMKENILENYL
ncbi:unnamed protein product [Adineta ricciae]|uniref:F-box domain-containing protein n=1 Tax=Adineta ricciae TaxID=249248 RepID=A0A815IE59_ADIRI|nr:unnamed protein product [Adineta ricciae]CAF1366933.1 unnamed protein product [Adineta ricciae]